MLAFPGLMLLLLAGWLVSAYAPDLPLTTLEETYRYPESAWVEVMDMKVHYRIVGEGPNLLLLHGTASSLHTWEGWTERLQDRFRLISLDLPGFGLTGPHPGRIYDYSFYVRFLEAFTDQLQLDQFSIAGNSLGGAIALQYTAQYPAKVANLILVDPSVYHKEGPPPLAFRLAQNRLTAAFLRNFTPKGLFKKSLQEVYGNEALVTEELIQRYYGLYRRAGNRQAFIDRSGRKNPFNLEVLPKIPCPTLIQWGALDAWIPVEHGARLAKDLSNARLVVYPNLGHVLMEEAPEVTGQDAKEFLLNQKE